MNYKREITLIKDGKETKITYYVKETFSEEFDCVIYDVGIIEEAEFREIKNFSPNFKEAVMLADYLYKCNAVCENIFLMGEEFLSHLLI